MHEGDEPTATGAPMGNQAYPPATWRLLSDGPADGALNMAVDEAILSAVSEGGAPPTLRFYRWTPPCLSVGYAQSLARDFDLHVCRDLRYGVVRRPTGGRAILHADELTYSIVLPLDDPRVAGGVAASYEQLSEGLLAGLRYLGLTVTQARPTRPSQRTDRTTRTAVCFELPAYFEIVADGRKLVGSAQLRRRGVVLQQGTMPLEGDITRIVSLLRLPSETQRSTMAARLARSATTLEQAAGRRIPFEQAAEALAHGFAEALRLHLRAGTLTEDERGTSERLRWEKYGAETYTLQR